MSQDEISRDPPETKRPGRQPFTVTDDQRAIVRDMRTARHDHDSIATALGISVPTLRKYFRPELDTPAGEPVATLFDADPPAPRPAAPPRPRPANRGGKPERLATFEERNRVSLLVAVDTKQAEIARILKCSEPWLRKTFRVELDTGAAIKRAELLEATWRAAKAGNASAMKILDDKFQRADLARFDREGNGVAGQRTQDSRPEPRPEPLGKKAQADADAAMMIENDPEVAALFAPHRSRPPATH